MSTRFDDRTLTRYLLGSLPAAEAERLDELSVTDEEVAEALRSVENDLIDAYVQDELDEAERAQFKSHYLASALRRERVAFAQAFQARAAQGLASQAATAQAEAPSKAQAAEAAPSEKGRGIFSAWRGFNVSRPAWAWGAALAAAALVAAGGWLILDNTRRQQQPAQTETRSNAPEQQTPEAQKEAAEQRAAAAQPPDESTRDARESSAQEQTQSDQRHLAERQRAANQNSSAARAGAIASFILAPQLRGASQVQSISIPTDASRVAMRLRLEPNESDTYRVALLDGAGARTLWRGGQVKARGSADGKVLSLNLRARLLRPQTAYLLRVTNDEGEIVDDYPFRVVK
jgi:hypothetical protein